MKRLNLMQSVICGAVVAAVSGAAIAAPCGMGNRYGGYAPPMPAYPGYLPYVGGPYAVPLPPMMGPYGPGVRMPMPRYAPGTAMPVNPGTGQSTTEVTVDAGPVAAAESVAVAIAGMRFDAPTVTVRKGGVVTWTNDSSMPHTVTANSGAFGSPQLSNGASWSRTFDEVGTFGYYCSLHPGMRGSVVVVE